MIVCSQPECQTTAGCKCNMHIGIPYPSELLAAKDTEIASLRERVKEQGAEIESIYRDVALAEARAETAERELAREREAFQRHEQTLRDNGIASHSEAVVLVTTLRRVFDDILDELGCERDNEAALEAIATLRRERDEARAALKPFGSITEFSPKGDGEVDRIEIEVSIDDIDRAARAITGED